MLASRNEKQASVSTFVAAIDDPTIKMVMQYFKIEDYDCFVRFAQRSGLKIAAKHKSPDGTIWVEDDGQGLPNARV